ncbi:DUF2202 domain-containing protein [Primorskyibacter sp. 2E233]|uniref:DUF2202 domain-containing protein n=1 Tax=Primorskyibacter sp. 2E233 TaxID=3413431 RepID=UPI003BF405BA
MKNDNFHAGRHSHLSGNGGFRGATSDPKNTQTDTVAETTEVAETSSTLSGEAVAELLFMIEEEKLAGDIYEAFYDLYGLEIFNKIADSEDKHFDALITQAEQLGIDVDDFVFAQAGEFEDPELQELYDTLLAQGAQSVTDALEVGKAIEEKDIVDIAEAAEAVEGTTLSAVYDNLLIGSSYHLAAFDALLV